MSPGAIWYKQGQSDQAAYILVSGWACSYKLLQDGQRQIVDFQIPGDFLGLRSVVLHISDHSVEPVTDIEVTEVQVADLLAAFSHTPRLATAVLLREAGMLTFRDGFVTFNDYDRLSTFADFELTYLDQIGPLLS